jgi:transglutaminase-like putative cysteine protease
VKLQIKHLTNYRYAETLTGESHMEARLRPLSIPGVQTRLAYEIDVVPKADMHGYDLPGELGYVDHFTLRGHPHRDLEITSRSIVATHLSNPFDGLQFGENDWATLADASFASSFVEYVSPSPAVPIAPAGWLGPPHPPGGVLEYGQVLMQFINGTFDYVPGSTDVATPLAEFVASGKGVCQDYAHYMISLARRDRIPARYVSGYVFTGSDGRLEGGDAMHAWVELYLPASKTWCGFDPTNNVFAADRHVKVAVGVDYNEVAPTRGLLRSSPGSAIPRVTSLTTQVSTTEVLDAPESIAAE